VITEPQKPKESEARSIGYRSSIDTPSVWGQTQLLLLRPRQARSVGAMGTLEHVNPPGLLGDSAFTQVVRVRGAAETNRDRGDRNRL
jgi:hypothetical protein